MSILIVCFCSLALLFSCSDSSPKSRLEKRMTIYLDRLESSAIDLEHELEKIADMKRLNTIGRMNEAISVIKKSELTLNRANQDIAAYIAFINSNSRELKEENLDHYMDVKDILNQSLRSKRQAIADYFQTLEKWLDYSATHFKRLEAKDVAAMRSYDSLLTDVNRSLKRYDTANEQYHQFVNSFLSTNPDLVKRFKREYKTMKKELGWM